MRVFTVAKSTVCGLALLSLSSLGVASDQAESIKFPEGAKLSLLKGGLAFTSLVYSDLAEPELPKGMSPTAYTDLATNYKAHIDKARGAAGVTDATFEFLSGVSGVLIAVPDPLTTAIGLTLATGAEVVGEAVRNRIIENASVSAGQMLAIGLRNQLPSDAEVREMSARDISDFVKNVTLEGRSIGQIVDQSGREIIQSHLIDLANSNAIESLTRIDTTNLRVDTVAEQLIQVSNDLQKFRKEMDDRLSDVKEDLGRLNLVVAENRQNLSVLATQVEGNSEAISEIARISFSGWSTRQKLQAVRAGLVKGLDDDQTAALLESLSTQLEQEKLVSDLSRSAQNLQAIGQIAANLGLPPEVSQAANVGGTLASGIASIAAGGTGVLTGIATLSSLVGFGKPDPNAERHRMMMEYLSKQFSAIHETLHRIETLQVKTLQELAELRRDLAKFKMNVNQRLDTIESIVLTNQAMLQSLLLAEWRSCQSLSNNQITLGRYSIRNHTELLRLAADPDIRNYAKDCYGAMSSYLDGKVLSTDWTDGDVVSAAVAMRPGNLNAGLAKKFIAVSRLEIIAYQSATEFLMHHFEKRKMLDSPQEALARITPALSNAKDRQAYEQYLDEAKLDPISCSDLDGNDRAMRAIMCFESDPVFDEPHSERLNEVLSANLLGRQVDTIVNQGILLAAIADFSKRRSGSVIMVSSEDITNSKIELSEALEGALNEQNGLALLEKLEPLVEMYALQKSITYGDYTAFAAMEALYNKETKTIDAKTSGEEAYLALLAMQSNPTLARNVVILGLRRSIEEQLGGREEAEQASYKSIGYRVAIQNFLNGRRCVPDRIAQRNWLELFSNWTIEYRRSTSDQERHQDCPEAQLKELDVNNPKHGLGTGAAVRLSNNADIDFYVTLPDPQEMSLGTFSIPDGLQNALQIRKRIKTEILNRSIGVTVEDTISEHENTEAVLSQITYSLVSAYNSFQK